MITLYHFFSQRILPCMGSATNVQVAYQYVAIPSGEIPLYLKLTKRLRRKEKWG